MILENYEGRSLLERHASSLIRISHFDPDMASRFSYTEIATAAILVAASHLADPNPAARLLPASLLTDRTTQAAATLRQLAARQGLQPPDTNPNIAPSQSPVAVDAASSRDDPIHIPPSPNLHSSDVVPPPVSASA